VALVVATVAIGGAHAAGPVTVLVVGDSVPAALGYQPALERRIAKGYDVQFDLQVCRRLASAGCPSGGRIPASALSVVQAGSHPDVLVVDVGYNDDPAVYGRQMATLVKVAHGLGVKQIVWVSLRETQVGYRQINGEIRAEARRLPNVQVADWNAWSSGKPWFRSDGLHLTDAGADGLALMLRVYIVSAAQAAATS
jgi:hypothetical protein